jgi:hypothetical protein
MQNKKILIIGGLTVLAVAAATFVGARLLNSGVNGLTQMGIAGPGEQVTFTIDVIPAPELPTLPPEVTGLFISRDDKTIVVQSMPLEMGSFGGGGVAAGSPVDMSGGPKVEVVITNETILYKDITQPGDPQPNSATTIQQTVIEGTLDDLNSQSMVTVWGRRSGDRVIAEVVFYSNPIMIQVP